MAQFNLGRVKGLSAYETWLSAGNTGTYEAYLEEIRGPQGPAGGNITAAAQLPTDDGSTVQAKLDVLSHATGNIQNDHYGYIIADSQKRAALGIKKDGTVVCFAGAEFEALQIEEIDLGAEKIFSRPNPEYLFAIHDPDAKVSELCAASNGRVPDWVLAAWGERMAALQAPQNIVCWGDSLTAESGWRAALQSLLNANGYRHTVIGGGVGGEGAASIAARQGSIPIVLNPFTLPASGGAAVTWGQAFGYTINLLDQGDSLINPCTILSADGSDITGTLSKTEGVCYFTRAETGAEIVFDRPVKLATYGALHHRADVSLIWVGTNNAAWTAAQIIAVQAYMAEFLGHDKYIMIGLTSKSTHPDAADKNTAMEARWGRHFLDIRKYLLEFGLVDAGLTPTPEDTAAIADGEIPPGLLNDTVHFNAAGYNVIGAQIYKKLLAERMIEKESV